MSKRRVVVTGMGCVTPYGIGVNTLWNNLKAGISGIKEHNLDKDKHLVKVAGQVPADLNIDEYIDPKEAKRLDKSIIYALIAAEEAFRDSGLDLEKEDKTRIGTIVSTAAGGLVVVTTGYKDMMARGFHKCSPFTVPMIEHMLNGEYIVFTREFDILTWTLQLKHFFVQIFDVTGKNNLLYEMHPIE